MANESADSKSLSDSPWFWFGLFAAMAMIALFVVGPKFATRQSKLQQNYEGRRDVWQRKVMNEPPPVEASQRDAPAR